MNKFSKVIEAAVRDEYSDIHITGGHPMVFRKNGQVHFDKTGRWNHREVDALVRKILTPRQLNTLRQRWSVDLAMSIQQVRIRVNVFNTTRGLSLAIRLLPGTVPCVEKLNLHTSLQQIAEIKAGLILVCGATGSGKSTTIAAIIDDINRARAAHIVTLEDPIEYRFISRKSFIEQRELGTHMPSFEQGLLDVLREAPDVIVVGELREPQVMRLTLNAAESGHLVIASLHATNVEDALYRLCNSFPIEAQEEIRFQLASALQWVIIQQLTYMEKLGYRVPMLSIARGTQSVKGVIRENKIPQIESIIQMGKSEGMFTMERYLKEYLQTKTSFHPPADHFKPSAEAAQELVYVSPLIDGDAAAYRPETQPAQDIDPAMPRGPSTGWASVTPFPPGNGSGAEKYQRAYPDNGNGLGKGDGRFAETGKDFGQASDAAEGTGPHLIIDEKATVDELIAQISNFGRQKA
ncbi:MAG TPA: PilT/PilU family type 4a pilus ATPase [Syntrophales bacterium]|jgi:pilus retraction protein PilT|nr:PilT/PilU family type 4a pilus ATPase [Syntrophales bacterium]